MKLTLVGLTKTQCALADALRDVVDGLEIIGHDPDGDRVKAARKAKAIDSSHWNLLSACEGAGAVLVDVPADEACTTLQALRDELSEDVTIIDHAALMAPRAALIADLDWPHGNLVQGHLVLKEDGVDEATYYVASRTNTLPDALDLAANVAQAAGCKPRFVDPVEHDGLMAATDQMPRLAALVTLHALADASGSRERLVARGAAVDGLRDLLDGALAESQAEGLLSNALQASHWLAAYGAVLAELRTLIDAGDAEALADWLASATEGVEAWFATETPDTPDPSANITMRSMFLGGMGRRRR